MRVLITFCFVLFSLICFGQQSANSNLSVVLKPIQSIKINEQQQNVNLSFETVEDYTKGKVSEQADHIEVMSSGTYEIRVVAATPLVNEGEEISIDHIGLKPSLGTIGDFRQNIVLLPVTLALRDNNIVSSSLGDVKRTFNVSYKMNSSEEILNKPTGTYSTVITYTILSL